MKLPEATLNQLKCSNCKLYLSCPPVLINSDGESICGRCFSCEKSENLIQNVAYEKIASEIEFPCRYKGNGCNMSLWYKDVKEHEDCCEFKICKCPRSVVSDCNWSGKRSEFLNHFISYHEKSISYNSHFQVPLDLTKSFHELYLVQMLPFLFGIHVELNLEEDKLYCSVQYFGDKKFINQFYCVLKLSKKFTSITDILKILPCNVVEKEEISYKVDVSGLAIVLRSDEDVKVDITINKRVDWKMLGQIECIICGSCSKPPVLSLRGNPVCFRCAPKACEEHNIVSDMCWNLVYPCAHKINGCYHIDSLLEIWKHEIFSCKYFDCFICSRSYEQSILEHFSFYHVPVTKKFGDEIVTQFDDCLHWILVSNGSLTLICRYVFCNAMLNFFVCSNLSGNDVGNYVCQLKLKDSHTGCYIEKNMDIIPKQVYDWGTSVTIEELEMITLKKSVNIGIEVRKISSK